MSIHKLCLIMTLIFGVSSQVFAANSNTCDNYYDNKCHYNASKAIDYATSMIDNKSAWNVYFPTYRDSELGGDCTNFVNQAILAGLVGSTSPQTIYNNSPSFAIDSYGCTYCWYFIHPKTASYAWKGAHELYTYAKENANPSYRGLHFDFQTKDSSTQALDFSKIKKGDVIFADWEGDGSIDHTMLVTVAGSSYSRVKVTYENGDPYYAHKNRSLGAINKINTVFHVYRPIYYTDYGY